MSYLELKNVTRLFRGRGRGRKANAGVANEGTLALDNVTISIDLGRSMGIVGESGSGKSTILNLLLGLDHPTSGEVVWRGEPLPTKDRVALREFRRQVQMVFQDPRSSLDPRMNVGRIISEPLRSLRVPGDHRERVREVMEWVELDPTWVDRYPAQFSGGQRQRIAIARALAPNPTLLIADEPVSALDVSVKASLVRLLASLKEELGLTLVMVSHDVAVVGQLCEETVVLQGGRIVETGPTLNILRSPGEEYTRRLLAAIPHLPEAKPQKSQDPGFYVRDMDNADFGEMAGLPDHLEPTTKMT